MTCIDFTNFLKLAESMAIAEAEAKLPPEVMSPTTLSRSDQLFKKPAKTVAAFYIVNSANFKKFVNRQIDINGGTHFKRNL
jgi:hypothetical protein